PVLAPLTLADLHALPLGRRERLGHELGRVLGPGHDVDLLTTQLVDHHAHPRAAGASPGALGGGPGGARAATQAPLVSPPGSWLRTAILVRCPGSRATLVISTMPSAISGTSSSNRRLIRLGWVRDTTTRRPLAERTTSVTYTFSRSLCW